MISLTINTVSFTGHRPDKLGGYNMKNPVMLKIKEILLFEIEDLIINHNVKKFISGGALGLDQAAFWCVHILQKKYPYIENVVAIPHVNFGKKVWSPEKGKYVGWSDEQIMWFNKILQKADEVVIVDTLEFYQKDKTVSIGQHSNYKLQIRNEYLVNESSTLLAFWDGEKRRGTWNCLKFALGKQHMTTIVHFKTNDNFKKEYLKDTPILF